jgi:hypothetical protein
VRGHVEPLIVIFLLVVLSVAFVVAALSINERVERLEQQVTCGTATGCEP